MVSNILNVMVIMMVFFYYYFQRVMIVSRWNKRMVKKTNTASTNASTSALASMKVIFRVMIPAIWPKNAASTGRMMIIDTCSATRGSFTREEMMMLKLTAESANKGPITKMAINQRPARKLRIISGLRLLSRFL